MTKRIKILFIMFQGGHSNLKSWNEYIIKRIVKPDRIEKVYYNNVKNRIKYVSKEEMDKIFT